MKPDLKAIPFKGVRLTASTPMAFDDVLGRLRTLLGKASFGELITLAHEPISEAEFVDEVQRRFVGESGFMLFVELDHGGWLSRFDLERRTVRWILGNPLIAITMMRHDITAGLFAPVEILITENVDRDGATLTYVRPSSLIVVDDNPSLEEAARNLDAKLDLLIAHATNL